MINLKKAISIHLIASLIYMVIPVNVYAAAIENIAEINYKNTSDFPFKAKSNQTSTQSEASKDYEVDLIPSFNSVDGASKDTWLFPAKVFNRGKNDDRYNLSLDNLPAGVTGQIYKDVNGNGKLDPEDTITTVTDFMKTGDNFPIIIVLKDNIGFAPGAVIDFSVTAKSTIDPDTLSTKPLKVNVLQGLVSGGTTPTPTPNPQSSASSNPTTPTNYNAQLKKTVFPAGIAKAGDVLTYYIEFTNNNNFTANNVVVSDKLPKGLIAITDKGLEPVTTNEGKITYSSDGGNYSDVATTNVKFLKFSWSTVQPSETVTAYFKAKIDDVMENGNLENIASATYKSDATGGNTSNTNNQSVQTANVMSNMAVNTIKNEYSIDGTIYDKKTGLPKEGAIVTVYDKNGKEVGKDITGKLGKYNIPVASKGDYKVVYSESNGNVISESISSVTKPGTNFAPIEIRGKVMDSQTKEVITNAELKLLDKDKKVLITIKTDSEGKFIFDKDSQGKNLEPGKYLIRVVNAKGQVSYARVNVTLSSGDMIVNLEILIDPFGTVYDEYGGTEVRIKDADVKLLYNCDDPNSIVKLDDLEQGVPQKNPFITDEKGIYQYFLNGDQLNNKNYCLSVHADGYKDRKFFLRTAPSKQQVNKYVLEVTDTQDATNKILIQNIETVPYNIGLTPLKIFDISKNANKNSIEIGEVVTYTVESKNKLKFRINETEIIDQLPPGFKYVPDSLKVNGNFVKNFTATDRLIVDTGDLNPEQKVTMMYQARTGIRVPEGAAINVAQIMGKSPKKLTTTKGLKTQATSTNMADYDLFSDYARATVLVKKGVFSKNGAVIGKVYIDENKNGMQDANEPGVPGVSLYTAGGIRVVTDVKGKYSIPDIQDGDFAVVLDLESLPKDLMMSNESQWIGQDDRSQRIFIPESGLGKVNFRLVRAEKPQVVEAPKENPLKAVYVYPNKFSIKKIPYITYPDIKDNWARGIVEYESGLDIIHGYPDGEFKPSRSISRAETTKLTLVALKSFDIKMGTTLSYILKNDAKVSINITDNKGNLIKTFYTDTAKKSGINHIYWDGKDDKDNLVAEGKYNFEVKAEDKDKISNTLTTIIEAIPAIPNYKPVGQANFKDVPVTHWATNFIKVGAEEHLVTGYPDETFRPDNFIPRFEMAVIAVKALNLSLDMAKDELPFEDASDVPTWARKYVYLAYTNGLLSKFPDNKFYPARNISRAEIAAFVNALINKQKIDAQVSGTADQTATEVIIEGTKIDLSKEKSFTKDINKDYSQDIDVSIPGLDLKSEFDDNFKKKDIKR